MKECDNLVKEFPEFYGSLYWGFECDDGWYDLLHKLSVDLKNAEFTGAVLQVKEKFGGLRFYWTHASEAPVEKVEKWQQLIDDARRESYSICEVCGKKGILRSSVWMKTLCEEHHTERKERYDKK